VRETDRDRESERDREKDRRGESSPMLCGSMVGRYFDQLPVTVSVSQSSPGCWNS